MAYWDEDNGLYDIGGYYEPEFGSNSDFMFDPGDISSFYSPDYSSIFGGGGGDLGEGFNFTNPELFGLGEYTPSGFQGFSPSSIDGGFNIDPSWLSGISGSDISGYTGEAGPDISAFSPQGMDLGQAMALNAAGAGDQSLMPLLAASASQSLPQDLSEEAKSLMAYDKALTPEEAEQQVAMASNMGLKSTLANQNELMKAYPGAFTRVDSSGIYQPKTVDDRILTEGLDYAPVHALPDSNPNTPNLGVIEGYGGLGTGVVDRQGIRGFGDQGQGLTLRGAPTTITPENMANWRDIIGESPADWEKNEDQSWYDYARESGGMYDPTDIGTDLRWLLGNSLPYAGYGGVGGGTKGALLSPERMAEAIANKEKSAGAGSSTGGKSTPTSKEMTGKQKTQAALGGANMLAEIIALLGKGDRKGPKSSQGANSANDWEVARVKNRGKAVKKADGGLVSIKEALQRALGLKTRQLPPQREERPVAPEELQDIATYGTGAAQNAARAIMGRRERLEELEREAVGKRHGGRLMHHNSTGQSDKIDARLSGGEYIMDADIVSALGDGNTEAGAEQLDRMREAIREHKRSAPKGKIPPRAKSPLEYMKGR